MSARTNLDIDVLRTFILGFELGSFAKAAERIGRSQSAVSSQLRKLEDQVGRPLVRKAGRNLALTEAGENLLSYARRIVELNDQAIYAVGGEDLQGWVRLGLPQDFAEAWLPDVLARFARSHPNVQVEVRAEKVSDLIEKALLGELDLSLAWGPQPGAPHIEKVADVASVWIGGEGQRRRAANDDGAVPLVAFEPPCAFRDAAVTALDRAGMAWRLSFTSPSLASLWAAAAAGRGVIVRTQIGVPPGLRVLEPRRFGLPELPSTSLNLVRAESEPTATVRALRDVLLAVAADRLKRLRQSENSVVATFPRRA